MSAARPVGTGAEGGAGGRCHWARAHSGCWRQGCPMRTQPTCPLSGCLSCSGNARPSDSTRHGPANPLPTSVVPQDLAMYINAPPRLPIGLRGAAGSVARLADLAMAEPRMLAGRREQAASWARGHARPPMAGPGVAFAGTGARRRGDTKHSAETAQLPAPGGRRALAASLLFHPLLPARGPQRPRARHPLAPTFSEDQAGNSHLSKSGKKVYGGSS